MLVGERLCDVALYGSVLAVSSRLSVRSARSGREMSKATGIPRGGESSIATVKNRVYSVMSLMSKLIGHRNRYRYHRVSSIGINENERGDKTAAVMRVIDTYNLRPRMILWVSM